MKIRPVAAESFHADGRTDRHSPFLQFFERVKQCCSVSVTLFIPYIMEYQQMQKEVKVSRNRPSVAQRVPGVLGSQISATFGT